MWTYEHDEELRDLECETQQDAQGVADEWWSQKCQDDQEDLSNGDTFTEDIDLIEFLYDPAGEFAEIQRIRSSVEYVHYHGDHAEHFRQDDYI